VVGFGITTKPKPINFKLARVFMSVLILRQPDIMTHCAKLVVSGISFCNSRLRTEVGAAHSRRVTYFDFYTVPAKDASYLLILFDYLRICSISAGFQSGLYPLGR